MKSCLFLILSVIVLFVTPLSFADQGTYKLRVEDKTFDVTYSINGEILAMGTDQESTSLLVGMSNVEDSMFEIGFSSELLSASNDEFVLLVDGLETDYTVTHDGDNTKITLLIEAGSEEIELVGTSVIPEFPLGTIAIMGVISAMVLMFSRAKTLLK